MNGSIKNARFCTTIVFANKNTHGFVKHPDIIETATFGAFSLKMYDSSVSKIIVGIITTGGDSRFLYAIAQVNVFCIHKKRLIKSADPVEYFLPDHHKCTCQHINFMRFIFVKMPK